MRNVLIIGHGWVAKNRHIPILTKLGYKISIHDKKYDQSVDTNLDFEFAVICVPPQNRLSAFEHAVSLGIKKVFLEKPISETSEDALSIISIAKENNITVRNCHNFLFSKVGKTIQNLEDVKLSIFVQANRSDRQLPTWVKELNYGIGLDEFAHFGYLSRILNPDDGLNSERCIFIENDNATSNRWDIQVLHSKGWSYFNLWTDDVIHINGIEQAPYWQYKESLSVITQSITNLSGHVISKLFRKSNDFGTMAMWKSFSEGTLSQFEDRLTTIESGSKILDDYFKTKK